MRYTSISSVSFPKRQQTFTPSYLLVKYDQDVKVYFPQAEPVENKEEAAAEVEAATTEAAGEEAPAEAEAEAAEAAPEAESEATPAEEPAAE